MRVKHSKRGFILILALVLSIAFITVLVYSEIQLPRWGVEVVVDNVVYHHHPAVDGQQRETARVVQGRTFIIRHLSEWDDPEIPGYYTVVIYWDCYGDPSENLTLLYAKAYFTSGPHVGEPIDNTVSTADNGTRYTIGVSNTAGDDRDGQFNVDIVMRASGSGNVPHIPGYHTIFHSGINVVESGSYFDAVDPIVIEVLPRVVVDISPTYQGGEPGAVLTYTLNVMNKDNIQDNYLLTVSDNAGWPLVLSENLLENVQTGENRIVTLNVTVPENTTSFDEDSITVAATSVEYASVSDNASCVARIEGRAEFALVTLYKVSLDADLYLGSGSKLVVKFYTYGHAFEDESVFENFASPTHIVKFENIFHPENIGVEKVRLDLTTDNTENEISTIASFTVTRDVLHEEITKEYIWWPLVPPPERARIFAEISDKYLQWPFAPT